jgi:hypothetical protein
METIYKHLEDEINTLEIYESFGDLSERGLDKLNEFRMIKRQLEILELMKKALMKEYGISPETY